jgi:hypothetical protein
LFLEIESMASLGGESGSSITECETASDVLVSPLQSARCSSV